MATELKRFGSKSEEEINAEVEENVPNNAKTAREFVWRQFHKFLSEKGCKLEKTTSPAKEARDGMRKKLQACPEKQTNSATALAETEFLNIVKLFGKDTPEGLKKKFFFIVPYELAWKDGEGVHCLVSFFKEEIRGLPTGRINIIQCSQRRLKKGPNHLPKASG
ncbi:hypothetical protein Zmor_024473 [Zophobas morio]|uniref:Uncharacterized protein n=1 Tax=Zophobas morio TaxID=2755281 RepID=A0AA38M8E1_9CUCU|nr:hypothetical protein Zmor_024473 [Zophobas morio]